MAPAPASTVTGICPGFTPMPTGRKSGCEPGLNPIAGKGRLRQARNSTATIADTSVT
jgi:hypothetical protein